MRIVTLDDSHHFLYLPLCYVQHAESGCVLLKTEDKIATFIWLNVAV
jgi:hypothetical protein